MSGRDRGNREVRRGRRRATRTMSDLQNWLLAIVVDRIDFGRHKGEGVANNLYGSLLLTIRTKKEGRSLRSRVVNHSLAIPKSERVL